MSDGQSLQQAPRRGLRASERPWLAIAILAMVLGAIGLGAFVYGLGGGISQTASTTPAATTGSGVRSQ